MLIVLHYADKTEIRVNPDHILFVEPVTLTNGAQVRASVRFVTGISREVAETPLEIDRAIRDARIEAYVRLGEVARRKGWDYR